MLYLFKNKIKLHITFFVDNNPPGPHKIAYIFYGKMGDELKQ